MATAMLPLQWKSSGILITIKLNGWLNGRMLLQSTTSIGTQEKGNRVRLQVRAITPVLAQLHIVGVRGSALLVKRKKLVLRTVKGTQASVSIGADCQSAFQELT